MMNRMHFAPTLAHLGSHATLWRIFVALALLLLSASIALAGPREQAARIHDRLAGVPADEATLDAMAQLPGNPTGAANDRDEQSELLRRNAEELRGAVDESRSESRSCRSTTM